MVIDRERLDELKIDRSREPSSFPRWPIWIAVLVIAGGAVAYWIAVPSAAEVTVAAVTEATAGDPSSVLNASGYITARRAATVSSKVTGKVVEVYVEEGMKVERGQLMARLDPAIATQSLRLAEAQARAAESALEETKVRIEQARIDERRAASLREQQVASQSDLDNARAELKALQARLATQRDDLAVAQRRVRLERQNRDDTEIRAPFAGIVVSKNAQAGEMISPISAGGGFTRTGIATVVDMDSLEIEVDVNESYINRVRPGQKVEAVLDAYPDWKIPAHVITVVPTADREKATVRVRIGIDARDPRILPDMGVKVSFIAPAEQGAGRMTLLAPKSAIRREGERDIVFVVRDNRLERRAVSVKSIQGETATLLSGVSPGEKVVERGPENLEDGQRVKVEQETQ